MGLRDDGWQKPTKRNLKGLTNMSMNLLKSLNRRLLGLTHNGQALAREGFVSGGEGRAVIVHPAPDTVAVFDDFQEGTDTGSGTDALSKFRVGPWIKGFSDTGQTVPATGVVGTSVSGLTNGVYRMTSSASSTQTPVGGAQSINSPPRWKANMGRLRFGARVKIADLAKNNVFVGFTDTGGAEIPVYDTGASAILTPAADYAGFLKGGGAGATATGLTWRLVAGKAGTDQVATTSITPSTNVYDTLEVEVSSDGGAVTGYINGKPVAKITSDAVTATTALAAGVWRANTEAAADAVDVDWMNVSAARDTGE
jgi:hypothetical protein